jgi:hypothetical protein
MATDQMGKRRKKSEDATGKKEKEKTNWIKIIDNVNKIEVVLKI